MPKSTLRDGRQPRIPVELVNIFGTSGAILAVVASGSAVVVRLPDPTVWQTAGAYLIPASLAFALYWWIAHKL